MAFKRTPNDRTLNSRVSKPHITYLNVHLNHEPHTAVRTTKKRDQMLRRIDILPPRLTSPSSMHKPFDTRFARHKSTWRSIAHGFVEQQQARLREAEGDEMECGYDTMDQLAAFETSGGVFGSPPASAASSPSSSSPSSDNSGSSATSWSTASTFSASTPASSIVSQPSVASFSTATSNSSADNSDMSSPEVDMIDASDEYESHVAAAPTVTTAPIPAPPSSQPPQPVTTASIAAVNPSQFSSLGYLPSKPLPTEKAAAKPRSKAPSLPPKSASKPDVELGMGSFSASKITSSSTLVSAFANPHFKQFFADEMKALQTCLEKKKKGIRGSDLVYLNRSLKWVIDAAEAKWFNPDIDFESDDVADWRGKLNVFMEVLGGVVGEGGGDGKGDGVAKDTKERIEKVFELFADEEGVNGGFGEEAGL